MSTNVWSAGIAIAAAFAFAPTLHVDAQTAALPTQPVTATAHLVLAGGRHAGTYDAQLTGKSGCQVLSGPNGLYRVGFLNAKARTDSTTFNQLSIDGKDIKGAASGTTDFGLTVMFGLPVPGEPMRPVRMMTLMQANVGRGSMTLKDNDSTLTVAFSGLAWEAFTGGQDSVTFSGTIDCKAVRRVAR